MKTSLWNMKNKSQPTRFCNSINNEAGTHALSVSCYLIILTQEMMCKFGRFIGFTS